MNIKYFSKSKKLRELLRHPKKIIKVAGAHDGLSAKLVEKAGFDAVWASSLEISSSYGVLDENILTFEQYLEQAIRMNTVTSIPVIVDCSVDYKDRDNIKYIVRQYEAAGIAAITMDDKLSPKSNSLISNGQGLLPIEDFVSKIKAAKEARQTSDFVVIARIEALIAKKGVAEALKRANAYADAGADAILLHSRSFSPNEIIKVIKLWKKDVPLAVIPTTYYNITTGQLKRLGVKIVIYANHGIRAEIKAMNEVFKKIIDSGTSSLVEERIASLKELFKLQRPL